MQWMVFVNRIFWMFSFSSLIVALAFCVLGWEKSMLDYYVLAGLALVFRAVLIPWLVSRNLHKRPERSREEAPVFPTAAGLLLALSLILLALGVFHFVLAPRWGIENAQGALALALLFQGAFLIVSRRNAFIQFAGYLVVENSVLLFAAWMFPVIPLVIEGAVVLDVLGLVIVARLVMRLRETISDNRGAVKKGYEHEDLKG
jgi:hydrogenase-4 component E